MLLSRRSFLTTSAVGMTAFDVREDVRRAAGLMSLDRSSKVHIGMSSRLLTRLSVAPTSTGGRAFPGLRQDGGELDGIPVHASDACGADVWLIDAAGFLAKGDQISIDRSEHGTLQLTVPTTSYSHDGASPSGADLHRWGATWA